MKWSDKVLEFFGAVGTARIVDNPTPTQAEIAQAPETFKIPRKSKRERARRRAIKMSRRRNRT